MRQQMSERVQEYLSDRTTIREFLGWLEKKWGGTICISLSIRKHRELDLSNELDEFHGIDRLRLKEERKK